MMYADCRHLRMHSRCRTRILPCTKRQFNTLTEHTHTYMKYQRLQLFLKNDKRLKLNTCAL